MVESVSLISWMADFQVRFMTWRRGALVGTDRFGNRYYRDRKPAKGRERRWVMYAGEPDASLVPPEWHGWLHSTQTEPIPESAAPAKPWIKEHEPNLSGTARAYRPPGHVAEGGTRDRATGDYEAWSPS